jgi:hypothetical protein
MKGTGGGETKYGKARGDTLKGFASGLCDDTDGLYGQGGNDKLFGGDGDDALFGGPGSDAVSRGPNCYGDVYYYENNSWGNDTITGTPESWSLWGNGLHFRVGVTTNLVINLNSSDLAHEVTGGTSTVNWSDNVIDEVGNYGTGDDNITGNDAANEIDTGARSSGGNDRTYVQDGFGGDTVDCGAGTDTVYADAGDELTNC